jgi:Glycosyl hydrolase family 3 C-terminal domain
VYATEYRYTLTDILRTDWGFDGYVQSDFWSCRSCATSLNAGMDHEMPDAKWFNETNVKAALSDTSLEIETIDRALVRRYTQMFRFGQFERPTISGEIDAQAHGVIARTIGSEIAVLLKNEGDLLPLDSRVGSIVIIGQSKFVDEACLGGGASSKVLPLYAVPPLEGMQDVLRDLGSSATVTKVTVADDLSNLDEARDAAKEADVVVLMAGLVATEGADQADANMLNDQNRMLDELLGINPTTVVVMKGALDRQGPGGPGGVEPGHRGRTRRRGLTVRGGQPLRQGADLLSQIRRRHFVRRQARTVSGHGRGRRLPGDPVLRRVGGGLPLVPGASHRAAVRIRLRPVLHHLRHY